MMAFTQEEAEEIREDFEDLEGTELIIHTDEALRCEVEHVAVAPFEREYCEIFLEAYTANNNPTEALTSYKGTGYDVIIIARSENNELIIQRIREYIEANGVRYNFPD